jgi:PAS domain S-box-containing protein
MAGVKKTSVGRKKPKSPVIANPTISQGLKNVDQSSLKMLGNIKLIATMYNKAPDAFFLEDGQGMILDCNETALTLTGYSKKELIGKDFTKLRRIGLSAMEDMLRQSISFSKGDTEREVREMIEPNEMPFITKDGQQRIFQISSTKVKADGSEFQFVVARDITDQSGRLGKLIKSEKMYRRMVEISPDAIVTANLKGIVTSVNQTFCKLTGYAKEEMVGKNVTNIPTLRSIDVPGMVKLFGTVVSGMSASIIEFVWKNRLGETRWGEAHVGILDLDGELELLVTLRDVTKRKAQEEAIAKNETRFRNIVENLNDGLIIHDLNGEIIETNAAAKRICGYKDGDELMGKGLSKLETAATRRLMDAFMKDAVSLKSWVFDGEFAKVGGSKVPVSISSKLVSTTGSGVVQTIVRDMSKKMNAS